MEVKPKITKFSLYDQTNSFGKIYCSWVFSFFHKYFKYRKLEKDSIEIEDFHRCSLEDESEYLIQKFERNYKFYSNQFTTDSLLQKLLTHNIFLLTLIKTFGTEAILPFVLFFVQDCLIKPIQPILIGLIIQYFYHLTENGVQSGGIAYCLLITGSLCLSSILLISCHHPSLTLAMKLSMRLKVVWSTLIYNKCLEMAPNSIYYRNISQIINLMTNDVRRFDEFALMSNYLLIVPIQTVLILCIAWYYIGYSCLATFSAFIILAYLLSYCSKRFADLRTKSIVFTEKRIKILNEVFTHIRAIKIYTLENKFLHKIISSRRNELKHLKFPLIARSITLSFSMVSSRVIMYFSFLLYLIFLDSKNSFHPETVFVSVTLFERLRYSLTWTLPQAFSGLFDIIASCKRMDNFLKDSATHCIRKIANIENSSIVENPDCRNAKVIVTNLCAQNPFNVSHTTDNKIFQLYNINFSVNSGEILSIIGPVGSGKTTLLLSLLSEIEVKNANQVQINGSIAYASQEIYCLNATIKENILFGRCLDSNRYKEVLEVCALNRDLNDLPLGDMTIVGQSGFTLSGGQKARISLARALYSDMDIYLLDDPLSAVDVHLARHIYQRCVQSFLRHKCVLIATHQLQFVPQSTRVLLLELGHSVAYGTFDELMTSNKLFIEFFNLTKHSKSNDIEEKTVSPIPHDKQPVTAFISNSESKHVNGKLPHKMLDENLTKLERPSGEKVIGQSMMKEYWNFLKRGSSGFGSIYLVLLAAILTQCSLYVCDYWLTQWNKTTLSNHSFLVLYTIIALFIILFSVFRSYTFYQMCLLASEQTHNQIAQKMIYAPINVLDYISIGKLLNYFSRDIGVLDETLPSTLFELTLAFSQVFSIVCVILFLNPYMSAITFVYLFLLFKSRQYFARPAHMIRKFEVQTRNSIFTHLNSTISGLSTIRAYRAQKIYRNRFFSLVNDHTAMLFMQCSSARLFCTIIDLFSFAYIILVLLVLFTFSSSTNGQLIGLCLGSIFNLIGVAQWAWKRSIDSDRLIVSFQNFAMFENLPNEEDDQPKLSLENKPFNSYPINSSTSQHDICLNNLSVYYWENDESANTKNFELTSVPKLSVGTRKRFVLNNIDLKVNFGEKIGICGRSGTGKSTLVNALLRFARYNGEIRIADNEIKTYSLSDLRRHISIIPQYPVIFNGSIRENLDLFEQHTDSELWNVLDKVNLRSMVESFGDKLNEIINVESQQMSMGQKQLICLARIMLKDNWLIILDEATANVDFHTDKLIQKTIREVFAQCTVITIAHRLDSIIDCDRILVFDNGSLIEDDTPRRLIENKQSHFAHLVKQTGSKMASRLENAVLGMDTSTVLTS